MVGSTVNPSVQSNIHLDMNSEARLDVFKSHWLQAVTVMNKANGASNIAATRAMAHGGRRVTNVADDSEVVLRYVDQMTVLLVEEPASSDGSQGLILDYVLTEDVLMKLLTWSTHTGKHSDHIWLHQLKMYECLAAQGTQQLLLHKPVIQPLLELLSKSATRSSEQLQAHSVLLLHQLSITLSKIPQLLELLFNASANHGPAKFLMFSLLIPYVHFDGSIGQQARDALLLIMALSAQHEHIGVYVAEHSDFCPVLATGLSGLYSSLPQKLNIAGDDWYQLTDLDICSMPELAMFLNSLEFCNAVVQVAHPLVREQLLKYIHDGFLVPVVAPALHQDIIKLPASLVQSYIGSSCDEVIASTAYLELFIRRTTEPSMIQTFLKFLLTEQHDDTIILDSLISRINSMSRLCMVSLSLFTTLINLNCEDVMFQLVFRYLISCSHVMVSQRRAVRDLDLYGRSAQKFLQLTPACCVQQIGQHSSSQQSTPKAKKIKNNDKTSNGIEVYEKASYLMYLNVAEKNIEMCTQGCSCWSARYDGEDPPPDSLMPSKEPTTSSESSPEKTNNLLSESLKTMDDQNSLLITNCALHDKQNLSSDQLQPKAQNPTETSLQSSTDSNYQHQDSGNATSSSMDTTPIDERHSSLSDISDNKPPDNTIKESSNNNIDTAHDGRDTDHCQLHDSPLDDRFSNADFNTFLLRLKDIDVPLESDTSIDESMEMIDEMITNIHEISLSADSSALNVTVSKNNFSPMSETDSAKTSVSVTLTSLSGTPVSPSYSTSPTTNEPSSIDEKLSTSVKPTFNPARYPINSPNIGPFLSALLQKLETVMQNTLYVNLLLTGLIARLACYSQPLLRSFLLNHTLVFQPTVKSLFQVLGSVKHKLDHYSFSVDNFDELLGRARGFLLWREEQHFNNINGIIPDPPKKTDSPSPVKPKQSVMEMFKEKRRNSLIGDLFRRNSDRRSSHGSNTRLQDVSHGYKYVNKALTDPTNKSMIDHIESVKTKNVVYAALVLEEFLKELAAITQEHAVHAGTQNTV